MEKSLLGASHDSSLHYPYKGHEKRARGIKLIAAIQGLSWATDWGELGDVVVFDGCRRSGCFPSPFTGTHSSAASPCPSRPLLSFNVRWSTAARCVSRIGVRSYERMPFPFLFEMVPVVAFLDITLSTSVLHPFASAPSHPPDPSAMPSCEFSFTLLYQLS